MPLGLLLHHRFKHHETSLVHCYSMRAFQFGSYCWVHIPLAAAVEGILPRSHHSCTLTGAGCSGGWQQGHGRVMSLTTILFLRMCLMAVL
jgi:hypothetical protein